MQSPVEARAYACKPETCVSMWSMVGAKASIGVPVRKPILRKLSTTTKSRACLRRKLGDEMWQECNSLLHLGGRQTILLQQRGDPLLKQNGPAELTEDKV